jgi:hypothetical protein
MYKCRQRRSSRTVGVDVFQSCGNDGDGQLLRSLVSLLRHSRLAAMVFVRTWLPLCWTRRRTTSNSGTAAALRILEVRHTFYDILMPSGQYQ